MSLLFDLHVILFSRRCLTSRIPHPSLSACSTLWSMPALQCSSSASSPSSSHTYYITGTAVYEHFGKSRCHLLFALSLYFNLCPYSTIHISRKSWHTLLNTCFHIAMTTAIYAGGIRLTSYPVVCQAVSPEFTQTPHL